MFGAKCLVEGLILVMLLKLSANNVNCKRRIIKMWTPNGAHIFLV